MGITIANIQCYTTFNFLRKGRLKNGEEKELPKKYGCFLLFFKFQKYMLAAGDMILVKVVLYFGCPNPFVTQLEMSEADGGSVELPARWAGNSLL